MQHLFREEEFIPISALQHMAFCPRQCALIHLEQIWDDNRLTVEGRLLHEKVHEEDTESRKDMVIVRALRVKSHRLGLAGVADVVECWADPRGVPLPGRRGTWRPYPVEYKRGRAKPDDRDAVQLCAQAMCLEEMLNISIPAGALYYGLPRRREEITLDERLRTETERVVRDVRELFTRRQTPSAVYDPKKCDACSIFHLCRPKTIGAGKSARRYVGGMLAR